MGQRVEQDPGSLQRMDSAPPPLSQDFKSCKSKGTVETATGSPPWTSVS